MYVIGLVQGHGYGKVVCLELGGAQPARTAVYPSVAAPASDQGYAGALGSPSAIVRLADRSEWLVGEDALRIAPGRLVSMLDRERYATPAFQALLRYGLGQVLPAERADLLMMTGMPAAWYADAAARRHLEAAIGAAAQPWGAPPISVAPEAAGVFYAYVFEQGLARVERIRGPVGVIDLGYRDANVALFVDGRYAGGESVPGGAIAALREIKALISREYRLELALHEVDEALRQGGVRVGGRLLPIPAAADAELMRGLAAVEGVGRSLWPSGGRGLQALVLGGGGAARAATWLRERFPMLVVPGAELAQAATSDGLERLVQAARPQLAGAYGFAYAAAVQVRRAESTKR